MRFSTVALRGVWVVGAFVGDEFCLDQLELVHEGSQAVSTDRTGDDAASGVNGEARLVKCGVVGEISPAVGGRDSSGWRWRRGCFAARGSAEQARPCGAWLAVLTVGRGRAQSAFTEVSAD